MISTNSVPLFQVVQDRDHQLHQLKCEWEEVHRDRKMNSITASDMSREIDKLTKVSLWTSVHV